VQDCLIGEVKQKFVSATSVAMLFAGEKLTYGGGGVQRRQNVEGIADLSLVSVV
jgi:hypothetical protein